jgi:hypothetical protein
MNKFTLAVFALIAVVGAGCTPIQGERFWWNDQEQAKLPNDFQLPDWPPETPIAAGETIFVAKQYPQDEVEKARAEEQRQIAAGIPRCGVPDPYADPVPVKVAPYADSGTVDDVDAGGAAANAP